MGEDWSLVKYLDLLNYICYINVGLRSTESFLLLIVHIKFFLIPDVVDNHLHSHSYTATVSGIRLHEIIPLKSTPHGRMISSSEFRPTDSLIGKPSGEGGANSINHLIGVFCAANMVFDLRVWPNKALKSHAEKWRKFIVLDPYFSRNFKALAKATIITKVFFSNSSFKPFSHLLILGQQERFFISSLQQK